MRALIIVAAVLAGVLVFLLTTATANTALFARQFPLLLGLTGAVTILLAGLVVFQLHRLWRDYKARVFGSRLKYRLLLMFALMAVVPGVLIYAVSVQFAVKSIESWFDVRVDAALEGGINLGRSALDYLQGELTAKAEVMALDLAGGKSVAVQINRLREQAGVDTATLFGPNGQVIASSSAEVGSFLPERPSPAMLRQVWQGLPHTAVEGEAATGLAVRALVPVTGASLAAEMRVLQLTQLVPPQIAQSAESVQAVYRDYQELSLSRVGLKRLYAITLTLTLLLALFAAIAVAFVLSRRLSAPLSILAEGTQAVAAGDFSPRRSLPARDELGVLTQSFNRMTRQLDDARALAERNRAEVEAARAYLESVLANLSAGVLAFARDGKLRAANRGAIDILGDDLAGFEKLPLAEWPRQQLLRDTILEHFADRDVWEKQLEFAAEDGPPKVLLLHGARLPEAGGGGQVVVFDDITQLISAQRAAAWGDVARRLAHEIKNPLTPIQLSAERLQHKLADKLAPAERAMLERSTQTIVNQVEALKNMVNDFRDYARLPPPTLAPLDLNALTGEVLGLYEHARVPVEARLDPALPQVLGDVAQLRQVIHNLLRNAEDALAEAQDPQIEVVTERSARGGVCLVVRDNGSGFPQQILSRAFEPYVTTKAKGTGLGLAIVKKIVDEHHGDIHVANRSPHGAEVRIRLQLAPAGGEAHAAGGAQDAPVPHA